MKPAVQKVINYGLGNLRLIFKYATEIGSVPVTGLESPFDDTFAKSIMKITSENENFPKKNSTVIIYTTPAAQDEGYVQMAALSSVMGYDKLIGANVAYFPGTKFFSEFPISIGKNIWNSFGFDRFTDMHKATGLPSGTILKNGGKTVIMDGKLKESVAEFCNSSNGKFGSVNQQSITGIGKLEKGKDLYIFAHSLGTALSMPFLYQSLASGNFGRIIVVTAGGYCSTNDVAAKQLQDMGLEIYNLQTLGDPITEWSHFESPGFAVLPGKVLRARFSTDLWLMNPFSLHNLGLYHAALQGPDVRFFDIANGAEYPEQKTWPADVSLESFLGQRKTLALEIKELKF